MIMYSRFLGFYKGNVSEINKAMKKGKIIPELFAEWLVSAVYNIITKKNSI